MPIKDLTCKNVYWEYISRVDIKPAAQAKWFKYLKLEEIQWEDNALIAFNVSRETHLQSFQYKILHFPCNYALSIWYRTESPFCKECGNIDYLEHYVYNCDKVWQLILWKSIGRWWLSIIDFSIELAPHDVILGVANLEEDQYLNFINLCILYAKWYIYDCKQKCITM